MSVQDLERQVADAVTNMAAEMYRQQRRIAELERAVDKRNQLLQAAAVIVDEHDPIGAQLLLEIEKLEDMP